MMMSHGRNRPTRLRVFRDDWMFYGRESRRNELVVSIATFAIVALTFWRFYHVACAIAKKVPCAKGVPIRQLRHHSWYYLRRNSKLYDIFLFRKAHCSRYEPIRIVWAPTVDDGCRFGHHLRRWASNLSKIQVGAQLN